VKPRKVCQDNGLQVEIVMWQLLNKKQECQPLIDFRWLAVKFKNRVDIRDTSFSVQPRVLIFLNSRSWSSTRDLKSIQLLPYCRYRPCPSILVLEVALELRFS
jgi:hypothetical protein